MPYKAGEPDTVFEFRWRVPEGGYRWVRIRLDGQPGPTPQWVLTDGVPLGGRYRFKDYAPLRTHPALFREFAGLEPAREAILRFAARYGWLGEPAGLFPLQPRRGTSLVGTGEPFALWVKEITAMCEAVRLWQLLQAKDTKTLGQSIRWEGDRVVYRGLRGGTILASPDHHPSRLDEWRRGDVRGPATVYAQQVINEHLKPRASPRLLREGQPPRLRLYFVPHTLIGALWLQLARAVDGEKAYRRCRRTGCGKFIEISRDTTGSRADRSYCSDACRSGAYRERRARD